jgi:hypothetical protein
MLRNDDILSCRTFRDMTWDETVINNDVLRYRTFGHKGRHAVRDVLSRDLSVFATTTI